MTYYVLDTSVYGVLVDRNEKDYGIVKNVIEYAKENRERFLTTFIISKELHSEGVDKHIRDIILPRYYETISKDKAPLEILFSEEHDLVEKLAWNYIQRLEKKVADEVKDDVLNYAWASVAGVDAFVTRNRRGILAESYWKTLEKSNRKMGLSFVKIISPTKFHESMP